MLVEAMVTLPRNIAELVGTATADKLELPTNVRYVPDKIKYIRFRRSDRITWASGSR